MGGLKKLLGVMEALDLYSTYFTLHFAAHTNAMCTEQLIDYSVVGVFLAKAPSLD